MARSRIRTVCPRNCYCTCGMLVTVEDGRILSIEGDPENPATGGKVCLKGLAYVERVTHPDRLHTPLRSDGRGGHEPVSWEEALADIAAHLARIREESGPRAVLYYEGSGSHGALSGLADAFWNPFGGPTRAHGDLCWPAGLEATRLTYGDNRHNHPALTRASRFILLWGHNPAETNVHQWRLILDAQAAGARVAVVDPRSTDTTDGADLHLQPRPGTDAALALGLGHVILEKRLQDAPFLEANALGLEAYRERVSAFTPEKVSEITGLPSAQIRELGEAYGAERPALIVAGFGLQRHRHAGQTMRALSLLPALTGNLGIAGGGWQYANLASHCLRPVPGLPPVPDAGSRSFPTSRLGWALQHLSDPPLRAAWFEKANPVSQHPRTGAVRDGMKALELTVVVDQFLTDTARMAHYVLPAKTLFEEEDLVTAYWHPYLQLRQKVLDPPPGVRTETEIWQELCRRLGFGTGVFDMEPGKRLRAMLPPGREGALEELKRRPLDLSGWGEVVWADGRFATPSGKVEFASREAERRWGVDPVPDYRPLPEGTPPGPGFAAGVADPGRAAAEPQSGRAATEPQSGRAAAEPQSALRFPLQLLTCKTRERIHSQFGNLSWIQDVERRRVLDIHPADALARGLGEGDPARIWNDRGSVKVPVRLNPGIRPGVVHVLEGRSVEGDPSMNLLTDDGVTDMGYGATFYECRVEVERP